MIKNHSEKRNFLPLLLLAVGTILILMTAHKYNTHRHKNFAQGAEKTPATLQFSKESGIYEEAFSLELSAGDATIYYTMDGSDPTNSDSRILYDAPIQIETQEDAPNVVSAVEPALFDAAYPDWDEEEQIYKDMMSAPSNEEVDKIQVIRAACLQTDGSYSDVVTNSYFVGTMDSHIEGIKESCEAAGMALSVMSISMNYDDLFDPENGIYVKGNIFDNALENHLAKMGTKEWDTVNTSRSLDANYKQRGREWERKAHIDYFESDGNGSNCILQQDCGIRIQGNYSRSDLQKGFRLYAREEYGDKNFVHEFFENAKDDEGNTLHKFRKLTLRNGGNCAFTTKYSDAYWQSLLSDMAVETQASRPCIVYLNGEYWGIYILQEDYDDHYFEETHGVDNKTVVSYKGDAETYSIGYKLDEGEIPEGESVNYYFQDLMNFFREHDELSSDEDFEALAALIDTDSVRDYFAVQIWVNNKWDWPGKNWTAWKVTKTEEGNPYADGRWRLCFYDLDFGGVSGRSDAYANTIRDDNYQTYGLLDTATSNPVVLMFAYCMTNETFREDFYARLRSLSTENFEKTQALAALDTFKEVYEPLYLQFYTRFMGSEDAPDLAENAVSGGYASYQCIADFLEERQDYIEDMIDWSEDTLKEMYE